MIVEYKSKNSCKFRELGVGEVFLYNHKAFIKIIDDVRFGNPADPDSLVKVNAVELSNGYMHSFNQTATITYVPKATVFIEA